LAVRAFIQPTAASGTIWRRYCNSGAFMSSEESPGTHIMETRGRFDWALAGTKASRIRKTKRRRGFIQWAEFFRRTLPGRSRVGRSFHLTARPFTQTWEIPAG